VQPGRPHPDGRGGCSACAVVWQVKAWPRRRAGSRVATCRLGFRRISQSRKKFERILQARAGPGQSALMLLGV
jgi:hypothetical protein